MSYPKDQLEPPAAATEDARSFELLRLWYARNEQHIALREDVWDDPAAWGVLLADLARQIATDLANGHALDATQTLARIRLALDAELGPEGRDR